MKQWRVVLILLAVLSVLSIHAPAQQQSQPGQYIVDFSGFWNSMPRNQDGSGMTGDAAGLPISQYAKWRAESWSGEDFDVAEWVCRPHTFIYGLEGGLSRMRVWTDVDQTTQKLIAYHAHANQEEQEITIWMDGRPRPPAAANHTWSGFSLGEWDGDVLQVTTTHLKEDYIRRSGYYNSDQAVVRQRWRRLGNYLQLTTIYYDPVYLAEPYMRSSTMFSYEPTMGMDPYPCEEATETAVPRGNYPHFLPGQSRLPAHNPKLTDRFGTPYEARVGGPDTMYPEYIKKMATMPKGVLATEVDLGQ